LVDFKRVFPLELCKNNVPAKRHESPTPSSSPISLKSSQWITTIFKTEGSVVEQIAFRMPTPWTEPPRLSSWGLSQGSTLWQGIQKNTSTSRSNLGWNSACLKKTMWTRDWPFCYACQKVQRDGGRTPGKWDFIKLEVEFFKIYYIIYHIHGRKINYFLVSWLYKKCFIDSDAQSTVLKIYPPFGFAWMFMIFNCF